MNNTLHTGGPWAIHTCNENGPSLDSFYLSTNAQTWDGNEIERMICRFPTGTGQFSDMGRENLANARLIAAAPDLLSALQSIVSDYESLMRSQGAKTNLGSDFTAADWLGSRLGGHIVKAKSVICKAKGEA